MVCKGWDLFVALSVWIGFCISRINTFNSSLVFAWLVFLCDLVYATDALARTSKQVCISTLATELSAVFFNASVPSTLEFSTNAPVIITFVPYHILVVFGLDIYGIYMLLCALRAAMLVKSGRITVHLTSLFSAASWKEVKADSNSVTQSEH